MMPQRKAVLQPAHGVEYSEQCMSVCVNLHGLSALAGSYSPAIQTAKVGVCPIGG